MKLIKMNVRKNNNSASRYDKLCLKKFFMIKKFNIKEEDFTMEFLMNWFGKEHVLDNALYALLENLRLVLMILKELIK